MNSPARRKQSELQVTDSRAVTDNKPKESDHVA